MDGRRVDLSEEREDDDTLEVIFRDLRAKHKNFPSDDFIGPIVQRILWVSRDIEILGAPLVTPTELEMMGLRILHDMKNAFEKQRLQEQERKMKSEQRKMKRLGR